ncbi:PleD family two-component system response regulator [Lutibaculum baratangense]|uniref:diguanylate cyclase n=1 Tax=Lutibaculum baratangense AMV1 TaxID=631454 RepID=V4QV11_9HYPH|nr:PleD family two-component system response regulator [Lutibaculum baratangense]ESR23592.1 Pole remodelling regulatory diguanylate cyclase [Lutibaculum baratangense AMV1]
MTARVLVVDDIPANVRLLEARLSAEYFEVVTAFNGPDALEIIERGECDIVLLDIMMPGMDGFEVCRRIKENPATFHIPVVIVTALDAQEDRVRGLEAGADDFLTKPVNDIALLARVKSLVRLKFLTDELRMRATTSRGMGMDEQAVMPLAVHSDGARVLLVDGRRNSSERILAALEPRHHVEVEADPREALFRIADGGFDVALISLDFDDFDGLRLCSQIRSLERTRNIPILMISSPDDDARLMRGLDLGVNDYITRPIDYNELVARVATQVRRKRFADRLRDNVQMTVAMALTDPLTGLHNRRYMESHLATLIGQAKDRGRSLSVLVLDIDYFKAVNDEYGHDVGDEVLREFSMRLRKAIRGIDLCCRLGGEEFVVVMPETELPQALLVGERIRQRIGTQPFLVGGRKLEITVSVGVAALERSSEDGASILKRADQAVYSAKRHGRNRVVSEAA